MCVPTSVSGRPLSRADDDGVFVCGTCVNRGKRLGRVRSEVTGLRDVSGSSAILGDSRSLTFWPMHFPRSDDDDAAAVAAETALQSNSIHADMYRAVFSLFLNTERDKSHCAPRSDDGETVESVSKYNPRSHLCTSLLLTLSASR